MTRGVEIIFATHARVIQTKRIYVKRAIVEAFFFFFFVKINSTVSKIHVKIAIDFLVLRGIWTKL